MSIQTDRLILLPATLPMLDALINDHPTLSRLLDVTLPGDWPTFPHAYSYSYHQLKDDPNLIPWWSYFFLWPAEKALIGSGGYNGRPMPVGSVEIGYEIAPSFRGLGFATEAASGLIRFAFSHPEVLQVEAHTLPGPNPSTRVLEKVGMHFLEALHDPQDGEVWHWVINRDRP